MSISQPLREEGNQAATDPERYRRTLAVGILVFRWVWLGWMVALAATASDEFRLPALAWISIGAAAGWTAWLTATRHRWTPMALWIDLGLCLWLVIASGLVVQEGAVISGRPFFATGYPLSAPLFWGASRGVGGGVVAGVVLGIAHIASRPLNAVGLNELSAAQAQNMFGAVLNYIVAGVAIGIVARVLVRSAEAVAAASENLARERERAARLAEREKLARHIHDSVLQALSLVTKKGRELATLATVPSEEVAALATLAGRQEAELRNLILREDEEGPRTQRSLRDALEELARTSDGVPVTVSTVGPIWLERDRAEELTAAAGQAVANVNRHAQATRATIFAELDEGEVVVTIRDDGIGFEYDEPGLREQGKVGILKSIKGRVEDLGGRMTVNSELGRGTEMELRAPERTADA